MPLLPIIVVIELISAITLIHIPMHSPYIASVRHSVGHVLGDTTDQPSADQPAPPTQAPEPTSAPAPAPPSNPPPTNEPSQSTPLPSSETATPPHQGSSPPPASESPASNPSPQTLPSEAPSSQVAPLPSSGPASTETPSPSNSPASFPTPQDLLDQINSPFPSQTPAPETSIAPSPETSSAPSIEPSSFELTTTPSGQSGTISPTTQLTPTPGQESGANVNNAVINQHDVIATPHEIDEKSTQQAQKEDEELTKTTTPNEEEKKRIEFAKGNVLDIDKTIKKDDFSSATFLTQRLNKQLDQAKTLLGTASAGDQPTLKKNLQNFCQQADIVLKTQELSVPENLEQDMEIARGTCLEVQQ